jgi:uncharacterized protein (DUF362 family)
MIPGNRVVALSTSARADYGELPEPIAAPELGKTLTSVAGEAVRQLFRNWRLDETRIDSADWNPLSQLVPAGARVVIKPNWVNHYNKSGAGNDCLLTHTSVLEAVVEYVALARPASITIGDAPIQSCNFERLRESCGLDAMVERLGRAGVSVRILDFRRTLLPEDRVGGTHLENVRPKSDYRLIDLAGASLLEDLAEDADRFRVTMYDPDRLQETHAKGRHQYLIAQPILDADVVINLPKLKTHKKAGITGALKNLVGINGNKEFLPHHRKGGSLSGGDCYYGRAPLKALAEELLDSANRSRASAPRAKARLAELAVHAATLLGADDNIDGSWFGNDTVWRMCLDLQRILRYARADGSLAPSPQRVVITITDAIVAGENEGPLAPTPIGAGVVTGAVNPPAAEWVHAHLMGFDPSRIPLLVHAFDDFPYRIADFRPDEIVVRTHRGDSPVVNINAIAGRRFEAPPLWRAHLG